VLLRRVAFKTFQKEDDTQTIWDAASPQTQQQVKVALLEGYEREAVVGVRHKICDTIADVARDCDEKSRIYKTRLELTPQSHGMYCWPLCSKVQSLLSQRTENLRFVSLPPYRRSLINTIWKY
jgi:hypothetical protein